jgi:ACS family hexuronate transporter-like MFS transporter
MLFAALTINYMDRSVISILKPTLEQSIGMTEQGYSYVVDAFFIAYSIGLLVVGRLVDKVGTRIGFLAIMTVRTMAAMGHGLANTVMEFGVARFALGLGESGSFPAAIKTATEWFPQKERALATGIFNSGTNIGAVLAALIVPWVTVHFGWHAAFLVTGAFSASWILIWYLFYRKPADHPTLSGRELRHICEGMAAAPAKPSTPWATLLVYRQTWAYTFGKALTDPVWWFILFWMSAFFSARFHLSLTHLGLPMIIVYNASAVGSIFGGWLPVPYLKMGLSPSKARLAAMFSCAVVALPICAVTLVTTEWAAIGLFSLVTAAHQGWSANLFTTASDMFPRSEVASVTGIGSMAGGVAATLFATFVGYWLQHTHNYTVIFIACGCAYLTALLIMVLLAPGLKKVDFEA